MKAVLERVEHRAGESFACSTWNARSFACPYHVHPEIEINYIASSSGRVLVGDFLENFEAGCLVLLGADLPHSFFHTPPANAPKDWAQSMYIQFLPDCLGPEFFNLAGMTAVRNLLERSQRGLMFPISTAEQAAPLLQKALESEGAERIASLLSLLHLLARAQGVKTLASAQFAAPQPLRSSERLARATSFIHKNLSEELDLKATAHHAGMSPQAFSRFFHRWMGRTFAAYVTELRIGSACQMLLETDKSIAEVCFASGYRNLSNFIRQFRASKQMTPREFRQSGLAMNHGSSGASSSSKHLHGAGRRPPLFSAGTGLREDARRVGS
ncbi:MAG: AraC family transcriptional regulator [Acidobacteriaceae bacterium]|nr:AraC family transcriptional regulator [Acidobacteriaceae bacterium]